MLYAIMGVDREDSLEARMAARPQHVARLKALLEDGKLIMAGPHPAIDSSDPGEAGFSGSLIIAEFSSLEDAKNWANADPYTTTGVFSSVTVKPYNKVLP